MQYGVAIETMHTARNWLRRAVVWLCNVDKIMALSYAMCSHYITTI